MARQITNESHWLTLAAGLIDEHVTGPAGYIMAANGDPLLGNLRVNVGHPSKFAFKAQGRALGETFEASLSVDGKTEIFISPFLDDTPTVLQTLVHEMGHATVGVKNGHNTKFVNFCKAVNLTGPATGTVAGRKLKKQLADIAAELGEYPRKKLDVTKLPEPQTTRQLKCICINKDCPFRDTHGKPYTIRMTWTTARDGGTPKCGTCEHRMAIVKSSGGRHGGGGGPRPDEEDEDNLIIIDPNGGGGESSGDEAESEDDSGGEGQQSSDGDDTIEESPDAGLGEEDGGEGGEGESSSEEPAEFIPDDSDVEDGVGDEGDGAEDSEGEGEAEAGDVEYAPDAKSERRTLKGQAPNNLTSEGGDAPGRGRRGRTTNTAAHPVDIDCECGNCKAARKLMGL